MTDIPGAQFITLDCGPHCGVKDGFGRHCACTTLCHRNTE